jgi:hypothetical protein
MKNDSILDAAKELLEARMIAIAPPRNPFPDTGYGNDVEKVLSTIINGVDPALKAYINRAQFFNSGNYGVSFTYDGTTEILLMYSPKRMGVNGVVKGNISIVNKVYSGPVYELKSDSSLSNPFPSQREIKMIIAKLEDVLDNLV